MADLAAPMRLLGEVVENLDALRRPVKSSERQPGPYPYYGAQGIVDYVSDFLFDGEFVLVAEDGENLRSRKEPVAMMARGKFWVNNHAHILRGGKEADTRYLHYVINAADISGYITGSTIPKLSQGNLNRLLIPCPPLGKQRAIASILNALDDKAELNRRMNTTLEATARTIFKDWFVDFGPTRAKMEGRAPYLGPHYWSLFPDRLDDAGKPEGWMTSTIGEEVDVVGGSTPSTKEPAFWGGGIAWATPKDLSSLNSLMPGFPKSVPACFPLVQCCSPLERQLDTWRLRRFQRQ
jgi:type I restriction enzyme S subunit